MAVKQLSVLVENEKGSLLGIMNTLAEAGVDLRALSVADTEEYGILRFIADDTEKAQKVLLDAGHPARVKHLVACAVADAPGGLAAALKLLSEHDINIEYIYSLLTRDEDHAYAVMRVSDYRAAEAVLSENGFTILTEEDI